MLNKLLVLLMAFSLVIFAMGCSNDEEEDKTDNKQVTLTDMTPIEATVTSPGDVTSSTTADNWTYFSFKTGTTVPTSQKNTKNWDIRVLGTKMSTNGGTTATEVGSGAGGGAMIMKESNLMKITQAPTSGYTMDVKAAIATMADPKPVVSICQLMTKEDESDPNFDDNQWYAGSGASLNADGTKCYVIKCGDGNYARVQFTNYTKEGDNRIFTISYNYTDQADGKFMK